MSNNIGGPLAFFSELLAGWNDREAGKAQMKMLRQQARQAWLEGNAAEMAQRREARRAFGKLRAAGAEMGLSESVSFADAYSQSAAEAELDALNIRYQGLTARQGLLYDSKVANASRPSWLQIGISAGARALSGGGPGYGTPRNRAPVTTSKPTYTRK